MFAFEEATKDLILPWVAETVIGSSVVTNQSSIMANQRGQTVSLQPDGSQDDPRRQQAIDQVLAQRERNMQIREEMKQEQMSQDEHHQDLIQGILDNDDELEPDDNPSENSIEIANRDYINDQRPRRPEYPGAPGGGGPGGIAPSDIIKNIDKIDKVATGAISIIKSMTEQEKKAEEPKTVQNDVSIEPDKTPVQKRQKKSESLKVDIHSIFSQTLRPKLNVRKME